MPNDPGNPVLDSARTSRLVLRWLPPGDGGARARARASRSGVSRAVAADRHRRDCGPK